MSADVFFAWVRIKWTCGCGMSQSAQEDLATGNLFWLADVRMARLKPLFPKSHGKPRVNDRRVLRGIILINLNDLR